MLPSRMTRIDGTGFRNNHHSSLVIHMTCQRQVNSNNQGKTRRLVASLTIFLALMTQHVTAFDYEQKGIAGTDTYSYDYEDDFNPVLTFPKSQDQSRLGKGEKIGEKPSGTDTAPQSSEFEVASEVNPDMSDVNGYNVSLTNTGDRQQQYNINSNGMSNSLRQDIDTTGTINTHQQETVSKDTQDEFENINHNFKHVFTSVSGTTLDKNKDKLVTRLTAHSSTNHTVDSGALMPYKPFANSSNASKPLNNRLDYRKEMSIEQNDTSQEWNFGSYNNKKVTQDEPRISNGATFFGNGNTLENMSTSLAEAKPTIYIAGLFPLTEDIPAGAVGRGVLPAVKIAVDHVNLDHRHDRKYILKMAANDTRTGNMNSPE